MLVVILVFWQTFERISAQGKQPTGSHEANFQWWVRNTFNLKVLPGGTTCIVRKEGNRNAGKYIAIKEHLYDMIASAHEQTCHGRRDAMKFKVCANVKLLWTSQHPNRITLLVQGLLYCPSRFVKDVIDHCSTCARTQPKKQIKTSARAIHVESFLSKLQVHAWCITNTDASLGRTCMVTNNNFRWILLTLVAKRLLRVI